MAGVIIRPAKAGYVPALVQLRRAIVSDPVITFTTVAPGAADIGAEIDRAQAKGTPFLVADRNGLVVGFATWGPFRAGPGYRFTVEHSMHVIAAARGEGIGRALLETLIERATAAGIRTMIAGGFGRKSRSDMISRIYGISRGRSNARGRQ